MRFKQPVTTRHVKGHEATWEFLRRRLTHYPKLTNTTIIIIAFVSRDKTTF